MEALFDTLLSRLVHASVQAVLLAGVVYAVCRLVPTMSASAKATLWWLLGAQLIAGIVSPTLLGLPLLPAATIAPVEPVTTIAPLTLPGAMDTMPAGDGTVSWTATLLFIWLLAVAVQAAVASLRWRRLAGVVHRAMPHDDVRIETLCARRARETGLHRSPRLAVSPEVDSPQVVGLWHPTILLPLEVRLSDEDLDLALMHELAHVRRGDLMLGWIPAIARALFFFHPVVHFAVREYALCREAACDALVVSRGGTITKTYGRLLLRLGVTPPPHHALPGASPTFHSLKRRLLMLAQANDSHPRVLTWCLVAAIAAVGVFPWRVVAADQSKTTVSRFYMPPPPTPPAPAPAATPAPAAAPAPMSATSLVAPVAPVPPVAPVAPVQASVPPVPPAPPVPAVWSEDVHGEPTNGFFYFSNDIHVASGSSSDFQRAEAAYRDVGKDFVWFRQGRQAWVIRDPAYVKRIQQAYAAPSKPADMAAIMADQQAGLDRKQEVLSEQMAKLSAKQSELISKQMTSTGPRDEAAYVAGNDAIGREQAAIARQMAQIGQQRALQGKTMAEWGRRQADASRKASEEVSTILADAIRNHAAQAAR
ncbi:M56 family metallopeptidase [Dyella sp. 333MFSha]|uniref:M56 family metallopeptidase n=1 Tax=Dyella sp. 333MFSha TaxID=1798240 RepID=UPI00088C80DF|nr:M56 family metallopeptidase [Dyella sp. 333MFSha]SDF89024.1 Signal transducer regulating beta-lactamase production, contains metallopeptidase domain [Dyella sp. 333MFSha]